MQCFFINATNNTYIYIMRYVLSFTLKDKIFIISWLTIKNFIVKYLLDKYLNPCYNFVKKEGNTFLPLFRDETQSS